MRVRLLVRDIVGEPMRVSDLDHIEDHIANKAMLWLDMVSTDPDELDRLGERFHFDSAAIEDILDIEQLPKFNEYDDHLFVVLHALTSTGERVDTIEVDCFITPQMLVTVMATRATEIDWLWRAVQIHSHIAENGSDELFGQLAEVIGRRYLEVITEFERRIDEIADDALDADVDVLSDIQVLRREETTVRKVLRPQRLVLANLRRGTIPLLGVGSLSILGDAYDVHNQVVESLSQARALLTDALDTYRGAAADRQASATIVLAVYSAILLPLTLITGFYGMNLKLPGDSSPWGWHLVSLFMIIISLVSVVVFVKIGLIRSPEWDKSPVLRGLASAARAPVKPFTMLRNPARRSKAAAASELSTKNGSLIKKSDKAGRS